MRPLRRRGTPKLHWRDETKPARRMAITETIAGCPDLEHLIVVRVGVASENQRRPRRAALKQLLLHLDDLKVGRAVLESRGTADDRRDIEVLRHLRDRQHTISTRLRVDHAPGRTDEGLWVPDAVCGAMLASRLGTPEYLEVLRGRVTVVTIDHRGDILI